jgi:hypothetical protein
VNEDERFAGAEVFNEEADAVYLLDGHGADYARP